MFIIQLLVYFINTTPIKQANPCRTNRCLTNLELKYKYRSLARQRLKKNKITREKMCITNELVRKEREIIELDKKINNIKDMVKLIEKFDALLDKQVLDDTSNWKEFKKKCEFTSFLILRRRICEIACFKSLMCEKDIKRLYYGFIHAKKEGIALFLNEILIYNKEIKLLDDEREKIYKK
ncbi:hypothetical protein ECANGB1_782 [Enterospora canceri]|uniref:Uncharacterized protein n=1 Tax=Enterospora canceri TaxID=1081671 RepID=A0A1Y1S7I5_9MICR|nr:hypothetical protein ECANGB1_782 [Enterospora canceri]